MQRIVFLAGRALPAALCFSTIFLKIGSNLVIEGHQHKVLKGLFLLAKGWCILKTSGILINAT